MIRQILTTGPISLDFGLVVIRVVAGGALAIHGWDKMHDIAPFVEDVKSMQIPLPDVMAWAATISEFFGGIFLAFGLLTRAAAIAIAATMAVAVFKAHGAESYLTSTNKQYASVLLASAAGIFLTGPGRFALDTMIAGGGSKAKAK